MTARELAIYEEDIRQSKAGCSVYLRILETHKEHPAARESAERVCALLEETIREIRRAAGAVSP